MGTNDRLTVSVLKKKRIAVRKKNRKNKKRNCYLFTRQPGRADQGRQLSDSEDKKRLEPGKRERSKKRSKKGFKKNSLVGKEGRSRPARFANKRAGVVAPKREEKNQTQS